MESALVRVLDSAVETSVRAAEDVALTALAGELEVEFAQHCCVVATWDDDVAAGRSVQRWWAGPRGASELTAGPPEPGDVVALHGASALGYVRVRPVPADEQAVLALLAATTGLVLAQAGSARRVRALRADTAEIQLEITESRQRAAVEMDLVRRDFERDLHDGTQGELAAFAVQAALLEHALSQASGDAGTAAMWDSVAVDAALLTKQAQLVADRVLEVANGTIPTVLDESGVGPALTADLPMVSPPGRLRLDDRTRGRRFPMAVEMTAYFFAQEAVSNACRHAAGANVRVTIDSTIRGLKIQVADDGPGSTDITAPGALRALRERAELAGADLDVRSSEQYGTTLTIVVPC